MHCGSVRSERLRTVGPGWHPHTSPCHFHDEDYSAFFLRRITMRPSKTTAITAHMMRTMDGSICLSFPRLSSGCGPSRRLLPPEPASQRTSPCVHSRRSFAVSRSPLKSAETAYLLSPPAYETDSIIGISSRTIFTATGPTVTTNSVGRMQKKIGNTSLTPSFAAFSSATWRA